MAGSGYGMVTAAGSSRQPGEREILRDLIPLNSLSEEHFREIAKNLAIEDIGPGRYLFGAGDVDNRSVYLLDGEVNFVDASGRVTGVVSAGTDPARYPLANQQPRLVSARVASRAVIASIDSTLLDVLLTFDQSAAPNTVNIGTQMDDDWLTRMFRSEAFVKIPPGDIQRMLRKMESVPVRSGDVIIRQGDEGDYFYILRDGTCAVTRSASTEGWDVPLAELGSGDCFGEEALVSDARRNATITMLTDGTLMRLSKQDFLELLKKPLVHYVDYALACEMVRDGDRWLDVRLPDEYANRSLPDSINIPLLSLRDKVELLQHGKKYIICCDTGRRSASAAFLLSQRGFEVHVLEGGLNKGVPAGVFGHDGDSAAAESGAPPGLDAPLAAPVPAAATPSDDATSRHLAQERDAARAEATTLRHRLAGLEEELNRLLTRISRYSEQAERLEAACREARQARTELATEVENLKTRTVPPRPNRGTNRAG